MITKFLCRYFQKESVTVGDIVSEFVPLIVMLVTLCVGLVGVIRTICSVPWDVWVEILELLMLGLFVSFVIVKAQDFAHYIGNLEVVHCKRNK